MAEEDLPHLFVEGFTESFDFKSALSVRRQVPPDRPRREHGARLLGQLEGVAAQEEHLARRAVELGLPEHHGFTLAIEVRPKGTLDFTTMEWKRDGIELLSVLEGLDADIATLHVPEGRLSALQKRVTEYLSADTAGGRPRNANLVNAIENIRRAAFAELWTDEGQAPPPGQASWYQVWIRKGAESARQARAAFAELAVRLHMVVEPGYVTFPGRVVVAVQTTRQTLENAIELLDLVAEIRGVAPNAEFFLSELKPHEQVEWIRDLSDRTVLPGDSAPYVTLLDTGVNNGHPLLVDLVATPDLHAYDPTWGVDDHAGHGTEMAGLALYGDLVPGFASDDEILLSHRLESVKLLPPAGQNPPHLYGAVTAESAERVVVAQPNRRRVFAMMTTADGDIAGRPSEWSATIDQLAFGSTPATGGGDEDADEDADAGERHDRTQRLFVLAAGNVKWPDWGNYPNENMLRTVEDPGQAWNALTVGASTHLTELDAATFPEHSVIASSGGLGPASRTSVVWRRWPFKPDVLAEGGNGCIWQGHPVVGPDSLRLLTTCHDFANTPLTETGDTSAAAAEVARLASRITAAYPEYWPETVRALVIHGARHTREMRGTLPVAPRKRDKETFLRTYGYGVIRADNSLVSSSQRPTIVIERRIQPYRLDGAQVKLGEMHLHDLPWPVDELLAMGEVNVRMRATLSYFVEPNPSRRGWQSKYRYQSFGLRFAVKAATEDVDQFRKRVNQLERDAEVDDNYADVDGMDWTFGAQLRSSGSVHSDSWTGNAAQLAAKSQIAVFPVGGWWKDWKEAGRYDEEGRYSLIISLEILDEVAVDIYTPIQTKIQVPIAIPVLAVPGR